MNRKLLAAVRIFKGTWHFVFKIRCGRCCYQPLSNIKSREFYMLRKLLTWVTALMGALFLVAYIKASTMDVVYTDYIRIVNSYLPDVYSFKPYMGLDILTRLPITYIQRIINVVFFSYSTYFDMYLGIICLALTALVIYKYAEEFKLPIVVFFVIFIVHFSLNKWEMLSNGSGWVHFLAFFLFVLHFYLYDKYIYRNQKGGLKRHIDLYICVLPYFTILMAAGAYSAIYALTVLFIYFLSLCKDFSKQNLKKYMLYSMHIIIPTGLYIYSRVNSVEEHAGSTAMSLTEVVKLMPDLLPRMFLKSFASVVIGLESLAELGLLGAFALILGFIVLLIYIYAIYIYIRKALHRESIFPASLIIASLCSHLLVVASRWIFLNDIYAMSSRYALQFQFGIIGIILTFALYKKSVKAYNKCIVAFSTAIFILGNVLTNTHELNMARYRKENFALKYEAALNFEQYSDKELNEIFQYRHDAARIRKALGILRDRKLNVFKDSKGE